MKKERFESVVEESDAKIECSWCKAAGLPKSKYKIRIMDIGGFDTVMGKPICRTCIETATKIEAAVAKIQKESIFSKAI